MANGDGEAKKFEMPVTLASFEIRMRRELDAFVSTWKSQQAAAPNNYPTLMSPHDWIEAFIENMEGDD